MSNQKQTIVTTVKSNKKEDLHPFPLSDLFDADKFFGNHFFEKEFSQSLPPGEH
ncbi:MAG: hypothetical protein V4635_06320 [Bacteroidota bacterium]